MRSTPDDNNFVRLVIGGYQSANPGGFYWHATIDGVDYTPMDQRGWAYNKFTPNVTDATIRVDAVGDTYTAYMNDVLVTQLDYLIPSLGGPENYLTHGRVALADVGVKPYMYFDDVQVTGVPEPSSFILFIFAAIGLLAYAWRRRKWRA